MATSTSTPYFLALSLFTTLACAASVDEALEEVIDRTHEKLISGVEYYILPAPGGHGGGLALGYNQSCPMEVLQEEPKHWKGFPAVFLPVNSNEGTWIRVSTDLNIKFNVDINFCSQSTLVWKLMSLVDDGVRKDFVMTGGSIGSPGHETLSNWFKIEKYEDYYKLSHCPSVCKFCNFVCKDLGIMLIVTEGRAWF